MKKSLIIILAVIVIFSCNNNVYDNSKQHIEDSVIDVQHDKKIDSILHTPSRADTAQQYLFQVMKYYKSYEENSVLYYKTNKDKYRIIANRAIDSNVKYSALCDKYLKP